MEETRYVVVNVCGVRSNQRHFPPRRTVKRAGITVWNIKDAFLHLNPGF